MKDTLEVLKAYLELYEIPPAQIEQLLDTKEIQLYAHLRDKLTYPELIDLQIVLNNIYNNLEDKDKINFNEYCLIDKEYISSTCDLLLENRISDKDCMYGISTIIAMEPEEILKNYLLNE